MKQYPSVPVSEIQAAGGLGPWLLKEAAKGKKARHVPSLENVQHRPQQAEKIPLSEEWRKLLDVPGVTEKPTPGPMNAWEKEHARDLFDRLMAEEISGYMFERFRFELGHNCRYIPDFVVMFNDGTFGADEVKGFFRDDAKVKLTVAARMYPQINFSLWTKGKGLWTCKPVRK